MFLAFFLGISQLVACSRSGEPLAMAGRWFAASSDNEKQTPKPQLAQLRGRVVELGPHLGEAFDIPVDEDLGTGVLVLVTGSGEVFPLIKDVRSRGFFMDKRLRDRAMELHVHRYDRLPFIRVLDVFSFKDGKKHKVDYWCTICAITTYEPGPCPCCQDDIELREVPLEESAIGR